MNGKIRRIRNLRFVMVILAVILSACKAEKSSVIDAATAVPTADSTTAADDLPEITTVTMDRQELPRYKSLELTVELAAEYNNPYDAREIALEGIFTGPMGTKMDVPGFWDGKNAWRVRFTPSQEGNWQYELVATDIRGSSPPVAGSFVSTPGEGHGWLQVGSQVDNDLSGRYLVYDDGTPFYGVGHGEALNILADGFHIDRGVQLFDNMQEAKENYVVWWPHYTNSPLGNSYDDYAVANLDIIDLIVRDAAEKGIFLIYTVWDHPQLRDDTHEWGTGNWSSNGFKKLVALEKFFTDEEAWAWQENYYRYLIARFGYSPAVGMWQTVSEINGTNAYDHADRWHEKVNAYFQENDPYRHPTTASMSGDRDWPAGHAAMDIPQVHVYELEEDAVKSAEIIADWTKQMWQNSQKPNWVGEYGVGGNNVYPELFHNSNWAALAAGAAMTPAEWNGGSFWVRMTPEMNEDIARLAQFIEGVPLAAWAPSSLDINSSDPHVRAWGIAGLEGGLIWIQDFAMEGKSIKEVRAETTVRRGVELSIEGLAAGDFMILPYDTWQGVYLDALEVACLNRQPCLVMLPDFERDIALMVVRQ